MESQYHNISKPGYGKNRWDGDYYEFVDTVDVNLQRRGSLNDRPSSAPDGAKYIIDNSGSSDDGKRYIYRSSSDSWELRPGKFSSLEVIEGNFHLNGNHIETGGYTAIRRGGDRMFSTNGTGGLVATANDANGQVTIKDDYNGQHLFEAHVGGPVEVMNTHLNIPNKIKFTDNTTRTTVESREGIDLNVDIDKDSGRAGIRLQEGGITYFRVAQNDPVEIRNTDLHLNSNNVLDVGTLTYKNSFRNISRTSTIDWQWYDSNAGVWETLFEINEGGPVEVRNSNLNVNSSNIDLNGTPFIRGGTNWSFRTGGKSVEVYDSTNGQSLMLWHEGGPVDVNSDFLLNSNILKFSSNESIYSNGNGVLVNQINASNGAFRFRSSNTGNSYFEIHESGPLRVKNANLDLNHTNKIVNPHQIIASNNSTSNNLRIGTDGSGSGSVFIQDEANGLTLMQWYEGGPVDVKGNINLKLSGTNHLDLAASSNTSGESRIHNANSIHFQNQEHSTIPNPALSYDYSEGLIFNDHNGNAKNVVQSNGPYEIQKNGSDGSGIINFKT